MLVAVRVDRVTLDTSTNRFVVILKDDMNGRWLPIVVGSTEAQAIALQLEKISPPRPLTHDLLKNILDSIKALITQIVVNDLPDYSGYSLEKLDRLHKIYRNLGAVGQSALVVAELRKRGQEVS